MLRYVRDWWIPSMLAEGYSKLWSATSTYSRAFFKCAIESSSKLLSVYIRKSDLLKWSLQPSLESNDATGAAYANLWDRDTVFSYYLQILQGDGGGRRRSVSKAHLNSRRRSRQNSARILLSTVTGDGSSVRGGFWAWYMGQNHSVSNSNRLHVVIFRFLFNILRYTPHIYSSKWSVISLKSGTSPCFFQTQPVHL